MCIYLNARSNGYAPLFWELEQQQITFFPPQDLFAFLGINFFFSFEESIPLAYPSILGRNEWAVEKRPHETQTCGRGRLLGQALAPARQDIACCLSRQHFTPPLERAAFC